VHCFSYIYEMFVDICTLSRVISSVSGFVVLLVFN